MSEHELGIAELGRKAHAVNFKPDADLLPRFLPVAFDV